MKVLMFTPAVDESFRLGFIPTWIRELAKRINRLYVITSGYNKQTSLPSNVTVFGLDKGPSSLIRSTKRQIYLHSTMLRIVPKVDVIFCHMHPEFTLRVAPYAKLFRKPIVTWYTHGHVSRKLKIARFLASKMVTASKESLRIKSNKIIITGHGIDTNKFKPATNRSVKKDKITILSVGRISPIKDYETLIRAADILVNEEDVKNLEFLIVGGVPIASQKEYYERLKKMVKELKLENYVKFVGHIPYSGIVDYYQGCDVFVSASQTGSIDKTVLEAMACEKPAITCNEAFEDIFGEYSSILMFRKKDPIDLAGKIINILQMDENKLNELCCSLRGIAKERHSVESLINKLVDIFEEVVKVR